MADERDRQFASELTRMSDEEVRQQMESSVQPGPFLRAMAITELERRRQKSADALMRSSLSLGRVAASIALLAAIGAVAWFLWENDVGYPPGR